MKHPSICPVSRRSFHFFHHLCHVGLLLLLLLLLGGSLPVSASIYDMSSRGVGPCRYLVGDVRLVTVFVDTPRSGWTQREIDRFYKGMWKNTAEIEKRAAGYGAQLSLTASWITVTTEYNVSDYGDPDFNLDWYWDVPDTLGVSELAQLHDARLDGCDDVAILFLFDETGRSYAYRSRLGSAWNEEFAV